MKVEATRLESDRFSTLRSSTSTSLRDWFMFNFLLMSVLGIRSAQTMADRASPEDANLYTGLRILKQGLFTLEVKCDGKGGREPGWGWRILVILIEFHQA